MTPVVSFTLTSKVTVQSQKGTSGVASDGSEHIEKKKKFSFCERRGNQKFVAATLVMYPIHVSESCIRVMYSSQVSESCRLVMTTL